MTVAEINNTDEQELIARLRDPGSRNLAFDLLVQSYQQRLYWHIRRILIRHDDTDDALQNTFVKAWQNFDQFREESRLFTWLYRIATNEALAIIKKKKNRIFLPIGDVEAELSGHIDNSSHFSGNEIEKKLFKALVKLPEKQRIVFQLKYFEEMKYEDMSAVLETSVGALKASYHHAVKKLEKYLLQP